MIGAAIPHELRKYSENGQLPLAPQGRESALGYDPALAHASPLCAALTAFTELVVARLGVFGAFVNLTDGNTQRLLAGTWVHSGGQGCDDARPRWLAGSDADAAAWLSLARRTIGLEDAARARSFPAGGIAVELEHDRRARALSCVVNPPNVKYYAASPIRTSRGICIGTLFLVDSVARAESFNDDLSFLSSVASKCMTQLETARESYLRRRITRISEGVCSFIHSRPVGADSQDLLGLDSTGKCTEPTQASDSAQPTPESNIVASQLTRSPSQEQPWESPAAATGESTDGATTGTGRTTYKEAFVRAAAHLRSALLVDGVIFVDGLVGLHGSLVPLAKREQEIEDKMHHNAGPRDALEEGHHRTPTPENADVQSSADRTHPDDPSGPAERTFTSADFQSSTLVRRPGEILGISVASPDVSVHLRNLSRNPADEGYLDERFLRKFLTRYPSGKIWYFDEHGAPFTFSDGETLVEDDPNGEAKQMSAAFPGIRQLIFAPLTDPVTLKRLAGCFAWTSRVHPVYTEAADLGPFRGFLHSVEAEVSRIDTVAAIKQQESFVSSVSHELRTPLHGILGAVEFLGETKLDSFQQGLAESIRSCGSTLHDTLSSVLSYSKINQFERRRNKSRRSTHDASWTKEPKDSVDETEKGLLGLLSSTNIATLCEEVVEVTAGGHTFNRPTATDDLTITLDVKYHANWSFMTEPGALRRIMTNILGNALKYTDKGFVKVGLDIETLSAPTGNGNPAPDLKIIVFSVEDSGKGMSKEFLEKHLSVPFTQEDTMASQGVGLGMSIVKSLVAMLGGKIRVKSQLGKGSTFTISIPMTPGGPKPSSPAAATLAKAAPEIRQRGLNVAIRGFHPFLQDSFKGYLRDWFNCNILSQDDQARHPDVLVADQADRSVSEEIRTRYSPQKLALLSVSISPSLRRSSDNHERNYRTRQTISRPIGPHKLSKALLACVENLSISQSRRGPELATISNSIDSTVSSDPTRMEVDTLSPRSKSLARPAESNQALEDLPSPTKRARHFPPEGSPQELPTHPFRASSPQHDSHQSPISPTAPAAALALEQSLLALGQPARPERAPRLLLVEDNAVNLKLLQTFMLKKGYADAATAQNGKLAVEEFAKAVDSGGGFDIIFMDISMPIMDGFDATRAIREIERQQFIAAQPAGLPSSDESPTPQESMQKPAFVVALTGLASRKDEDKAYRCGVDLVITKPVKFGKLAELFEKWEKGDLHGGGGEPGAVFDELDVEEGPG